MVVRLLICSYISIKCNKLSDIQWHIQVCKLSFLLLSVTCVSPRWSGMCSTISLTGTNTGGCVGTYILTDIISYRRPVYYSAAKKRYLLYAIAYWVSISTLSRIVHSL